MEMVGRKRGDYEISKCLTITDCLERVLMLLHIEILTYLKPVQMQTFRIGEQNLLTFESLEENPGTVSAPV